MDSLQNLINQTKTTDIFDNWKHSHNSTATVNIAANINTPKIQPKIETNSSSNKKILEIKDEFVRETKKQGLFERFYNVLKNKTGLGIGSKKTEQIIDNFEKGKASEDDAKNAIAGYKTSQQNAAQNLGDFTSAAVAITGYYKLSNITKEQKARFEVNAEHILLKEMPKKFTAKLKNFVGSSIKTKAVILPLVMLAGGMTKYWTLKINRIGSKEFKVENERQLDKDELKKTKNDLNHKRHIANFKNFGTGALNALLAPITAVAGGIVGVPAYLLATSGIRFLTNKSDNKDKSASNYIDNLKSNAVLNSVFALALAVPAFKNARYSKVLSENLEKVVKKLKDVKLQNPDLSAKSAYSELESIMLESENIKKILLDTSNVDYKVNRLTEENIFAVKFLQISNGGGEISKSLKENCPPTRTIEQAQQHINTLLNSDKYKVSKLLGVGTVAESYLAKDQSGKEVCIKVLKKGIDAEKIQKDKEAFIRLVTGNTPKEQLTKSQQYLVKNIENLAEGVSKEVDFENELKAAQKLKKHTKIADVVIPIEAKPGIYIMEKAPGISLDTLVKYYEYERKNNFYKNYLAKQAKTDSDREWAKKNIIKFTNKIKELKARSPEFSDFDLSPKEINLLLKNYIDVLVEQFTKVEKNGKTLHADIHPGNIFINLEALKTRKGKLFTLIDTGNTIDLSKEQAATALKLTSFVENGNVKDIAKYALDGAALPQGLSKEKALEYVEQELRTICFDDKTVVFPSNNKTTIEEQKIEVASKTDKMLQLVNNILRKHNIIPNDSQLSINKAKKSADNSLNNLIESFFNKKYEDSIGKDLHEAGAVEKGIFITRVIKDLGFIYAKQKRANTIQETKNLWQMSLSEIIRQFRNPNMLKTNREEHLTYKLKQDIEVPRDNNMQV
jgi:hypothetical protein